MIDGNRVYPVDYLVMHHSTGPDFANSSDAEVQAWFSSVGKQRGYQNGAIHPYHTIPGSNILSYAMAHFALRPYTKDGNKYGWRLTPLIDDAWNNVAWHAGDWPINQRSIGIETCGNYLNQELPDKALMLVADFWRGQDQALNGKTLTWFHGQIVATACPGKIKYQIDKLVDMQNNPAKWNVQLWPPVTTTTTQTTTTTTTTTQTTTTTLPPKPNLDEENNIMLKKILEIVTAIWQKIAGVFK